MADDDRWDWDREIAKAGIGDEGDGTPFPPGSGREVDEDLDDGWVGTEPVELTEHGVALAFTNRYGGTVRYDHHAGRPFRWSPRVGIYEANETGMLVDICRRIAARASEAEKPALRKQVRRKSFALGAAGFIQCDPVHAVTATIWDPDPLLLGCPGVTVDLRTGKARLPSPEDFITRCTAVAPDVEGHCPTWLRFLEEATGGDEKMVDYLQTIAGYALTGETREHKFFFLYGDGGTGKTTFQNVLRGVMGSYAQSASISSFTAAKYESHPTDMAAMRGARLITVSEVTEGRYWDEARVKQLTGGDKIRARFMRENEFEYTPQFKLVFAGNHRPPMHNVDDGMKRRLRMIPFDHRPARADAGLEGKLRAEWPGILRWMIRGCQAWREEGLRDPEAIVGATDDYFGEQDVVGQWIAERCRVDRNAEGDAAGLFAAWKSWAEASSERVGTAKWFGEVLTRKGFKRGLSYIAGVRVRVWVGLSLR